MCMCLVLYDGQVFPRHIQFHIHYDCAQDKSLTEDKRMNEYMVLTKHLSNVS